MNNEKKNSLESSPIGKESWAGGKLWLAYTLFYGFMPAWLGMLAGVGFSFEHQVRWQDFLIHGEFLIYSASLVAASTRLITRDVETGRPFPHRPWFNLISHAIIIPSAAIYAIAKALSFLEKPTGPKTVFLICFSLAMLIFAIVFSFLVFVLDHNRSMPLPLINVTAEIKQEEAKLADDFDKLGRDANVR